MYNSKIIVQAVFFLFIFNLLYLLGKTGVFLLLYISPPE